jgi:hypothetical protein
MFGLNWLKREVQQDPVQGAILDKLAELTQVLAPSEDLNETSPKVSDLSERVDALELRYETLKKECLRYLQHGSQRLKKAEEIEEDWNDDRPETVPLTPPEPVPEEPVDALDHAMSLLRNAGETPIIG